MRKVDEPSQAVLDFDRLETSFTRGTSVPLSSESRAWWVGYYDRRINDIATVYKTTPEQLIADWMKWRSNSKG